MDVDFKFLPFPHITIDNFFNEQAYDGVWAEVQLLKDKMMPPQLTGAAMHMGVPDKRGYGVFLNEVYKNKHFSNIVRQMQILQSDEFKGRVEEHARDPAGFYFKLYTLVKTDVNTTLVQMYTNGDYYKPHKDSAIFTFVAVLHKKERQYTGGEFHFPEYDYTLNLENNQAIIFPSVLLHEVKEIKIDSNSLDNARFSISSFFHLQES